jgi:tRNA G46 methylase TrmB
MRSFQPEKVPRPPEFAPFTLDPARPLDVEIGCGVGLHPIRYARAHPERDLIAFERTSEKFEKFSGRLKTHPPLPNLRPVHGDAIAWITHGLKPQSVDQYFLLYPNPYPKEGQRNLRFHEMPFFTQIKATLKPGGMFTMATNERFYAEESKARMLGTWGFTLVSEEVLGADFVPRTHFEKKYLARGLPCWNQVFRQLA